MLEQADQEDQADVWSPTAQGSRSATMGHSMYGPGWALRSQGTRKEKVDTTMSYYDRSRNRMVRDRGAT